MPLPNEAVLNIHEDDNDPETLAMAAGFESTMLDVGPTHSAAPTPAPAPALATPAVPAVPSATAPAPAPAEPVPGNVDPFKDLPPAIRDMLAIVPAQKALIEQQGSQLREAIGRIGALQSRFDKLSSQAPAAPAAPAAPSASRFEKVEALRRSGLPEIADAFDEISAAMPSGGPAGAPPAAEKPPVAGPPPVALTPQEEMLTDMRPTWSEELVSTDFQLWLAAQPPAYREQVNSTNKPSVILRALEASAAAKGTQAPPPPAPPGNDTRAQRIAAGVQPQGGGRRLGRSVPAGEVDEEQAAMDAVFAKPGR